MCIRFCDGWILLLVFLICGKWFNVWLIFVCNWLVFMLVDVNKGLIEFFFWFSRVFIKWSGLINWLLCLSVSDWVLVRVSWNLLVRWFRCIIFFIMD